MLVIEGGAVFSAGNPVNNDCRLARSAIRVDNRQFKCVSVSDLQLQVQINGPLCNGAVNEAGYKAGLRFAPCGSL